VAFAPVTILGVDTAIRKTGYAVLRLNAPGRYEVIDCGLIRNAKELPHSECLRRLAGGIREIVRTFRPDSASIEMAFVSKNIRTAMILSLARGAVIASLAESSMAAICGIDISGVPDDATDALALALCHANISTRKELLSLTGTRI